MWDTGRASAHELLFYCPTVVATAHPACNDVATILHQKCREFTLRVISHLQLASFSKVMDQSLLKRVLTEA